MARRHPKDDLSPFATLLFDTLIEDFIMQKYYAVNGTDVRIIELRETPKFLISDNDHYGKFKKIENPQDGFIATNRKYSNYSRTGYEIYELSAEYPKKIIKENKERYYVFEVKQQVEKRLRKLSLDEALSLNDLLGLGIKHPHQD